MDRLISIPISKIACKNSQLLLVPFIYLFHPFVLCKRSSSILQRPLNIPFFCAEKLNVCICLNGMMEERVERNNVKNALFPIHIHFSQFSSHECLRVLFSFHFFFVDGESIQSLSSILLKDFFLIDGQFSNVFLNVFNIFECFFKFLMFCLKLTMFS